MGKKIEFNKTYIIAEAGVNHNGDLQLAKQLIVEAARIGADAIKFQSFQADKIVHPCAPKAEYQKAKLPDENQYDLLRKLELSNEDFIVLKQIADAHEIILLSTPFDVDNLHFLIELELPYIKIASGDITYAPLLLKVAQNNKKVFLSTGMSTIDDIWNALCVLAFGYEKPQRSPSSFREILNFSKKNNIKKILKEKVTLFHCTSEYPAPFDEINLNVLTAYEKAFGLDIGYSDHSTSTLVPCLAVAKGASVIEKHFTLDNSMQGPDHTTSLNVTMFSEMIQQIRITEKILGDTDKKITPSELKNKSVIRRGVYAANNIKSDQILQEKDFLYLRPETNKSPIDAFGLIGSVAQNSYEKLAPI